MRNALMDARIVFYIIIFTTFGGSSIFAQEVIIPCGSFAEGSVWSTNTTTDNCNIEGETVVLSNKDNVIVLGQKTINTCYRLPAGPANTFETILRKEGDAVYMVGIRSSNTNTRMRRPFCGKLPSRMESQKRTTGSGPDITMDQTITIQQVGEETITVPAGTFDTVAIVIKTENVSNGNAARNYNEIMTIFAAEEVGITKSIMKVDSTVPAPTFNTGESEEVNKALQEGIADMMKGKSRKEIEEKLAAIARESARKAPTRMVERRTTLVTELQSYSME